MTELAVRLGYLGGTTYGDFCIAQAPGVVQHGAVVSLRMVRVVQLKRQ